MTKSRICIMIRALELGGAEKQSLFLAKALNNFHDIDVVVFHGEHVEPKHKVFLDDLNISPTLLRGGYIRKILKLHHLFRLRKFSFVFCYLPSDNLWGGIMGKLTNVDCIVGGIRKSNIDKHKHFILRFLHKKMQHYTIFNSHFGRKVYQEHGFQTKKNLVIENCIELNNIKSPDNSNNGKIKILMVGRFVFQKDYETGLKCIAHLYHVLGTKNIELNIVGYGKLEENIKQWIREYNISEITTILKKPENLKELYSTHDIYYSCSIFEGLSNTIMEAMGNGLPVLVTEVGDNSYFIDNNINGLIVKPKNAPEHAKQLKRLCDAPNLRSLLGKAGYITMKENFSFDAFQEKYMNFINSANKTL